MNEEFVYILSNSENKDIIKIGKTKSKPDVRVNQLNRQTGTIGEFRLLWSKNVPNCDLAENILKYILRNNHYSKEYYKISPALAIEISESIIESTFLTFESQVKKIINNKTEFIETLEILNKDDEISKEIRKQNKEIQILKKITSVR